MTPIDTVRAERDAEAALATAARAYHANRDPALDPGLLADMRVARIALAQATAARKAAIRASLTRPA